MTKERRSPSSRTSIGSSRETRSLSGNESSNPDKASHHIGDLIVNLMDILPVKSLAMKLTGDTFLVEFV